jgi:hypothetical protein
MLQPIAEALMDERKKKNWYDINESGTQPDDQP